MTAREAETSDEAALRSALALQVLPSVGWMFVANLLGLARLPTGVVRPGERFSDWEMPPPPIPYERIYRRRFKPLQGE